MDDSEPEDTEGETDSPLLPVAGTLYFIGFGTVVMAVGFGIAFGLTQNLEPRWQKYLYEEGYGTTEQLRDKTNDWEPNDPGDPLKPLPEKTWDRFSALTTSQRVALFKGLLVGPVFFLPGFFLALGMLLSLIRERGARRLAREFPERPWLHDSDWSQLRGSPRGATSVAGISMMLGVFGWLALCATLSWALEPDPEWNFTLVMFVVNLATAFIAVLTIRRFLQRFKFGQPQLLLAQVPIEQGKTFSARLLMSRSVGAAAKLKATLWLEKRNTSGSGKNQQTDSVVVCERVLEVPRSAFFEQDGRLAAELRFEVPEGQPFTRFGGEPTYEWQVAVEARTTGVDFEETFSVPVYRPRSDAEKTLRSSQA